MSDIRDALERLVELEDAKGPAPAIADAWTDAIAAARAALAQPEPEGVTDEELEDFALQNGGGYFNCDCQEEADILTRKHISNYRAVLARWGHPAPPAPAPEVGEVAELVRRLRDWHSIPLLQERERAATLLLQLSAHASPSPQARKVPV